MGTVLKMLAAGDDSENPDAPRISFEAVWLAYPRKIAKKDAHRAWLKVNPKHHQAIIASIESAKRSESWREAGGKYIPYLSTWLNGERWEDQIESDITMGQCVWNRNGTRGPGGQCQEKGVTEKHGQPYCKRHGEQV